MSQCTKHGCAEQLNNIFSFNCHTEHTTHAHPNVFPSKKCLSLSSSWPNSLASTSPTAALSSLSSCRVKPARRPLHMYGLCALVCMCVCVCVYIYIHVYTTHKHDLYEHVFDQFLLLLLYQHVYTTHKHDLYEHVFDQFLLLLLYQHESESRGSSPVYVCIDTCMPCVRLFGNDELIQICALYPHTYT
jgi:hypothetical protein